MKKILFILLLIPLFAFAGLSDNDPIVNSGNAFTATYVQPGVAGTRAIVILYNPVNSGKNIYLDIVHIAHSAPEDSGCDFRVIDSPVVNLVGNGVNKKLGAAQSTAEIRTGNVSPGSIPGTPTFYECWIQHSFDDKGYVFKPAILIPPGYGVNVASSRDGAYFIVSFQFREYQI